MLSRIHSLILVWLCATGSGCALWRPGVPNNPFFVSADNQEAVWERTVTVVHHYFDIARENKLDGVIETRPKVGASLLEPWHHDSVGLGNRLESSLQSIRRRGFVNITPTNGGYLVGLEVFKELEDQPGITPQTPGGGTFQQNLPLRRDLNLISGQAPPAGWIVLGRDERLEREMLVKLQREFSH